ncbi:replication protein A 70 kDa DNA-binding subunit A-like [Cryptomeria japonica]|uniref:replication protein A 70 kDa DNA-binding subunit A-like n=1 Tax=Cryptomeria japonica TaxID=3369 RepID=UPI0027D9F87C|nr:replication protein A 70 kDa DNA-binding subunit A-like [Cryptomeria japonica]
MDTNLKATEDINNVIDSMLQESDKLKSKLKKIIAHYEHKSPKQTTISLSTSCSVVTTIHSIEVAPLPIPSIEQLLDPTVIFTLGDKEFKCSDNDLGWVAWVDPMLLYICTMASSAATSESIDHSTIDNLAKNQEYVPTPFAIQSINAGDDLPSALLQVLSFQKMQNNTDDTDKHKLVLSDGKYMQLAILPSKYATLIDSDILKIGTIIQLSSYTYRYIWNTRTIVILSLEVKQSVCPFFGKPEYLFKEQQPEIMFEDRPSTSKQSLQFATELPSPQTTTSENICPIKTLNPYQNKWTIKGKVTHKRPIEAYSTTTKNGHVFSFDIVDCDGSEIRITCFDGIAKLHYKRVDIGSHYIISKGSVKEANVRKDGSKTQKRVVKINDLFGSTVDINLWGPIAEQKGLELKNMLTNDSLVILALCNARVGYFNGKLVNITATTTLHINPSFPEAELLTSRGRNPLLTVPFVAETIHIDDKYTRMTISSIRERMSIKPETIQTTLLAILRYVNVNDQNFYYTACPLIVNGRPCKKKCTQQADDSWFCSRCQMSMQDCNYSYLLPLKLQDATGTLWATAFDEGGNHLLHKTVRQLYALQNDATTKETPSSVIKIILSHYYLFTVLVCTETYNSESKMKVTVNKVSPVDFKAECHALLAEISRLSTDT